MKIYSKLLISVLTALMVLCVFTGISCSLTEEGVSILTGDYESPNFISFDLTTGKVAKVVFSKNITLEKLQVTEKESSKEIQVQTENRGEGNWELIFSEDLDCKKIYVIEGRVKDESGNELYFKDDFIGFNSRVPEVLLNEVRSEYNKQNDKAKCEFIELYVKSDGNLSGMVITVASDGEVNDFTLPAAEVKEGEHVVVHFRKLEENLIDELGEDTTLSTGLEATEARDIWVENKDARIGKSDIILLKDKYNGKIVDSVLYAESSTKQWKTEFMQKCAAEAFESGSWKGGYEVENAACSDGITLSRTLCRIDENSNDKNSWIIVNTSKATMGKKNLTDRYVVTQK